MLTKNAKNYKFQLIYTKNQEKNEDIYRYSSLTLIITMI